jgi:hypothetical protein
MIEWFVGYALRKRVVVAMVWTQLAFEAYPNNPDTSSQAIAQAPGVAAEEG